NDVTPSVTTGNLDGHSGDEIIFSFTNNAFGQIEIYNDGHPNDPLKYSHLKTITGSTSELFGAITKITAGDIDGDGVDEIIFVNEESWIHIWDDSLNNFALIDDWSIPSKVQIENILVKNYGFSISVDYQIPESLVCGDIDRDGADEILVSSLHTLFNTFDNSCGFFSIWDYNQTTFSCISTHVFAGFSANHLMGYSIDAVVGDFNADQLTLKYTSHAVYSTNEQLFAVMAAPPTQDGISQNYDDSSTDYGHGRSESGAGFGGAHASFGAYVALDVDISAGALLNLKIAKIEAEASLQAEFSYTYTKVTTTTYMATYSGDYSNDYVIFSTCVYDLFTYEIVAAPDPYSVGENFTIHIPDEPDTYKWDLEYYNSHNSPDAIEIGNETYNHTIGYIPSYPSEEEMDKIAPQRIEYAGGMQVGKGSGVITVEIDLSVEHEHEFEFGATIDWKVGAGSVLKGGLLGSIGAHGGFSIGWGSETMFSGTVGDIADESDYANFRYKFALCVYKNYVLNETLKDMAEDYLKTIYGFDPNQIELGDSPPSKKDNPYLDSSQTPIISDELLDAIRTVGWEGILLGVPYYILNYWVEMPEYWGKDAQQVVDFASDVDNVLSNFETPGLTFFSIIILIIPIFIRLRRRQYSEYRKREEK
ncbi:MAG: FG-GAP repeat domain-containing protein, partial [Candidatus Hodarchaeota archaeon]